jgi:hypothetical protein
MMMPRQLCLMNKGRPGTAVAGTSIATTRRLPRALQPTLSARACPMGFGDAASPFFNKSAAATAATITAPAAPDTLMTRLGGDAVLTVAVDEFYANMVVEPSLKKFFDGVDVDRLKKHQFNFMKIAFTGIPEGMDVEGMIRKVSVYS